MKKISKMKSSKFGGSSTLPTSSGTNGSITINGKIKNGLGSSSSSLTNGTNSNQDEINLKLLRDLCHLIEPNRYCFDCGQRGPTYVNVTVGSFICMTCSGLLRGLTPPHRVKSISMASFTSDEMELLKTHGNEYCRKVWLSTHTAKDSALATQNDSDRMNALKSHLSAKYEQKRYYVDPSRLPKSELIEIQNRNLQAISSASSKPSNGTSLQLHTHHHNQKSPSLTSTKSNPSPILNNLRTDFSTLHEKGKPSGIGPPIGRLSTSATLPEIKPLSLLLTDPKSTHSLNADLSNLSLSSGSSSVSSGLFINKTSSSNSTNNNNQNSNNNSSVPINFINNLTPPTLGNSSTQPKVLNSSQQSGGPFPTSWETQLGNLNNNSDGNFNANFANFEDGFKTFESFNTNNTNGFIVNNLNGVNGNQYQTNDTSGLTPKMINGGFQPSSGGSNNKTLEPSANGLMNSENGDKYAALKDLDSMFKQQTNGDVFGSPPSQGGIPNSMSVPAKLSSSDTWFPVTQTNSPPNQQNPFSQTTSNGWPSGNGMNGTMKPNVPNPHNPFYSNGFGSPSVGTLANGTHSQSLFSGGIGVSPMSTSQTNPNFSSTNAFNGMNGHAQGHGVNTGKSFNPFASQLKSNPNNPFL